MGIGFVILYSHTDDISVDKLPNWLILAGIIAGALIACVVGLLDDLYDIAPRQKFLGQAVAAGVLIVVGVRPDLQYLFSRLGTQAIGPQTYGNPDSNGNGLGVTIPLSSRQIYELGPVMDAIVASRTKNKVIVTGPLAGLASPSGADSFTYFDAVQDMVDHSAEVCIFNCPMCLDTLKRKVTAKGMKCYFISDLARLALGEKLEY